MSEVQCHICNKMYEEEESKKDIYPKKCPNGCEKQKIKDSKPKKKKISQYKTINQNDESNQWSNDTEEVREFSYVNVIDFDMSFINMVVFMIKWVIASIPAIIILFFIFVIFNIITTGMGLGIAKMFQ